MWEAGACAELPVISRVDFHFDVMCPFAYQTAKWIREVRAQNGLEISWQFFSLEEVNRVEGKKHPWEREWSYGWSMMRIGALLRRSSMDDLDRWYERAARALHEEGHKPHDPDVARHLLEELGFDPAIVDEAIADPTTGDEVKAEHDRVVAAGGYGVPTLVLPRGARRGGRARAPVRSCRARPADGRRRAAAVGRDDRLAGVPLPVRAAAPEERACTAR